MGQLIRQKMIDAGIYQWNWFVSDDLFFDCPPPEFPHVVTIPYTSLGTNNSALFRDIMHWIAVNVETFVLMDDISGSWQVYHFDSPLYRLERTTDYSVFYFSNASEATAFGITFSEHLHAVEALEDHPEWTGKNVRFAWKNIFPCKYPSNLKLRNAISPVEISKWEFDRAEYQKKVERKKIEKMRLDCYRSQFDAKIQAGKTQQHTGIWNPVKKTDDGWDSDFVYDDPSRWYGK